MKTRLAKPVNARLLSLESPAEFSTGEMVVLVVVGVSETETKNEN